MGNGMIKGMITSLDVEGGDCQNHSMDAGSARAKGLVLRGRTIDAFTP
jgi:hypothetical protein